VSPTARLLITAGLVLVTVSSGLRALAVEVDRRTAGGGPKGEA